MTRRTLPAWQGRTPDTPVPGRVKVRVFTRFDGRCQCGRCGSRKIAVGEKWQIDHATALINGGTNTEDNLVPILTDHHKLKTAADVAEKSSVYEKRARHIGVQPRKHRWGYGKNDPLKKKITGEVVRR